MMLQETNRIEFKSELNDKFEKEIVAFLNNHEGGILYIGLDDNGKPVGLKDIDSLQLKISDRIKDNISPSTLGLFDSVTEEIEGKQVIKVLVSSGLEKPYYIKRNGMSPSGCYKRVGTSTLPMPTAMIDALYSRRIHTTLRNIKSPRQDLEFAQLMIYYQQKRFELNDQFLKSLELYTEDGKFNYVGYLLADENAVSMKVAKYAGTDKVDLLENDEYGYCSIIKATYSILQRFQVENTTKARITSTVREEKNLVDPVALREAIINAVVHNDFTREIPPVFEIFSNRIEITSYGGLILGQTKEDFFSCRSVPRNRELMRVFKDLGLVEQLGSGMSRILKAYNRSIFKISDNFIQVVFPIDNTTEGITEGINEGISQREIEIVKQIKLNPSITMNEISHHLGVSIATVERDFDGLKKKKIIERRGSFKNGVWIVQDQSSKLD